MVQITRDLKTTPGMGIDDIEWKAIEETARAHGGRTDGVPKDTLDGLREKLPLNDMTVRQRTIAALLRFADELADKRGREARLLLANQLLKGSEVYHAYSYSLHTVEVQPGVVTLHFDLEPGHALMKLKKGSEEVYLYDEIVKRVLKMYVEGVYCSRYMRDFYELKVVNAHVDITEYPPGELARELMKLSFSFEERGYPAGWLRHQKRAREILGSGADELKTGEEIKDLIEQQATQS